ncbi:hypothetical protein [Anaerotignum sp.]|uniref:hypothetical protein n=1 Tax=Anaerotignum sp. TaxID=2039241 RepID=UPI0033343B9C
MEDVLKSAKKACSEVEKKYFGKRGASITVAEIREFFNLVSSDTCEGICMIFNYGFMKGVRYQQAQEKKKAKIQN